MSNVSTLWAIRSPLSADQGEFGRAVLHTSLTHSDSTLRISSLDNGETLHVLSGHRSRIWDVASASSSSLVVSASGDGTLRIWSTQRGTCENVLQSDGGDVYGVRWRPDSEVSTRERVMSAADSRTKWYLHITIGSYECGMSRRGKS